MLETIILRLMRLNNCSIFILGATKFDGIYESTSFTTAKFLARDNDVFYLDFPYTIKDFFSKYEKEFVRKRKSYFFSDEIKYISTDIPRLKIVILPLLLSINFFSEGFIYRKLLSVNEGLIIKRLKKIIEMNNLKDIIFINSFNFHYPNVGKQLKPRILVYHCVDPLIIDYDKKHGFISEKLAMESADLVVCTSKQLFLEKRKFNTNTFFIPNAADLSLSSQALNENCKINLILESIPHPIVGYFGNIERRIDFKMIEKVASQNIDKSFVFVGPVSEEFIPIGFREIENIYFTGKVPYSEMPSVVKGFDLAMIPFKRDTVSKTIFPLKLFEYLGAGKPVISTDFNLDLKEFTEDAVPYCANAEEFSTAMEYFLKFDDKVLLNKRLEIASQNTWDRRLNELSELIYGFFKH